MLPHNMAGLEIRDTAVLYKNVHHQFKNAEGMHAFSVTASCARAWSKNDVSV